jgi:hypothetical protein
MQTQLSQTIAPLTIIGNVADFDAVRSIAHDSEYVQVQIQVGAALVTYARQIRQRCGIDNAKAYADLMAGQVREVASLVSASALIAWLLDTGFTVSK